MKELNLRRLRLPAIAAGPVAALPSRDPEIEEPCKSGSNPEQQKNLQCLQKQGRMHWIEADNAQGCLSQNRRLLKQILK